MRKTIILLVLLVCTILAVTKPGHAVDDEIHGPAIVHKQTSSIVTINDILLLYHSDNRFVIVAEDGYTGNGATVGTYQVILAATDGISTINRTIQVKVQNDIGNITLVGDGNIYLRTDQVLDFTQIRTILRNVGYIHTPVGTGYSMILDNYTGHETETGVYDYQFKLISSSGYIQDVAIKIYVSDDFTSFNSEDIIPGEPSPISRFFNSLLDILTFVFILIVAAIIIKFIFFRKRKVGF